MGSFLAKNKEDENPNKLFVDEIYFNNSKWRIRFDKKTGQLHFEYYEHHQWRVDHRIIH